jgi:hypothetical protein
MTTIESSEVGRHVKENPPVEEQTPVVLEAPKHVREENLDSELTSEEEQALAEYVESGEVEACSKKQGLFDGLYEEIVVKEYKPREGQASGALHLYGVRMDGEADEHLSWDEVAAAYGQTVEPVPGTPPARHRLVDQAQNTPLGNLNSIGQEVPLEKIKKERLKLTSELEASRLDWLRHEAEKGRQTLVFSHKERNRLWEQYQNKFQKYLDYEDSRMNEGLRKGRDADNEPSVVDVLAMMRHQEERMLAYRYAQAIYEATGYYGLEHRKEARSGLRDDGVFGFVQVVNKHDQPMTDWERFAQWYGDTSGTKEEQIKRSALKVAVVVGGGLAVGAFFGLTMASAGFLAAPVAAAGGGALSARVGKSIFLSKLNSKARDMNITTHADDAQMRLLKTTEYAKDGSGRVLTTRRTWNRKEVVEDRSMQELIRNETNRNIEKNIIRFGAMALSAAVAAAAGLEVTKATISGISETVKAHNPFSGWSVDWFGSSPDNGTTTAPHATESAAPTPSHAPTPTPTPSPEPTTPPAPTHPGGGHHHGNGHHHHGNGNEQHTGGRTLSLGHKGDTIWGETTELAAQNGVHLSPAETHRFVGQILWQNHETWSSARHLPVDYHFHIGRQLMQHYIEDNKTKDSFKLAA